MAGGNMNVTFKGSNTPKIDAHTKASGDFRAEYGVNVDGETCYLTEDGWKEYDFYAKKLGYEVHVQRDTNGGWYSRPTSGETCIGQR